MQPLLMVLSGCATLAVGSFTLLLVLAMFVDPTVEDWMWGVIAAGCVLTVILSLPIVLLTRGRRR
ncbi:hypothetical protein [Micromonospora radicis]|uniref:Uncharacterized protein n=1 Tax=Micromonospora radicis TaxID=1894971 RepID=A0A418MUI5_9ACTN|nr:hypothetical protein [Micromonospora radicis]RIV38048.1 hypothetical protein D2L64_14005 [Micromonospora radicis]